MPLLPHKSNPDGHPGSHQQPLRGRKPQIHVPESLRLKRPQLLTNLKSELRDTRTTSELRVQRAQLRLGPPDGRPSAPVFGLVLPCDADRVDHELLFLKGSDPLLAVRINYLTDAEFRGQFDPNPQHQVVVV
jgi:hypothetical protein